MLDKKSFRLKVFLYMAVFCLVSPLPYAHAVDRDTNPPGTNWENPPGPQGGPGTSPDRKPNDGSWRDRDENPPGPYGGRGTNWENPPGPQGGQGTSPDRRSRNYPSGDGRWWDRDENPPGPSGGPGTNWENPPGERGGSGTSPNR